MARVCLAKPMTVQTTALPPTTLPDCNRRGRR
jgi:hypothetical protein